MADETKYEVRKGGRWVEVDWETWRAATGGHKRATRITGGRRSAGSEAAGRARRQLKRSAGAASNWVLDTNIKPGGTPKK